MHTSAMVAITMAPTYFPDMSGMQDPGGAEVVEFTVASNDVVAPPPVAVAEPEPVKIVKQEQVAPPPPPPERLPDKVEDEPDAETAQGSELNVNDIASGVVEDAESNTDKSGQITQYENELYINTVPGESDTFAEESQPNEVRQNIPHKE